jgi:hypothetical protein
MTTADTPHLDRLRRRAHVKALRVHTRLIDRSTPWRDWQSLANQLTAMGWHDIDSPEQTEHELEILDWFLSLWLEQLETTDGIIWSDPDDGDE